MEKKMTKVEIFTALKDYIAADTNMADDFQATCLEFIDKELASLEKRKESAQKRAAAHKEASDALTEDILTVVKDAANVVLVDDIVAAFDNPEVTRNKITARLGKLVSNGLITKEVIKVDGSRKMGYKVAEEG
jgi:hypothetical protein